MADAEATLVDVRSRMEYEYVGHPIGAIHVAWKEFPDWQIDEHFVFRLTTALVALGRTNVEHLPIYLICRSGARSLAAARELEQKGFTNVFNIETGFEGDKDAQGHRNTVNGWRFHNLPWEQD